MKSMKKFVTFDGKDGETGLHFLVTANKEIQDALEGSTYFGVYFELDSVVREDVPEKVEPIVPRIEPRVFATVTEAKEFLIKDHAVTPSKIPNRLAVLNKAAELGLLIEIKS